MTRVYVVVEGQTEEAFVDAVLAPALWPTDVYLTPIVIGPPGQRGGRVTFDRVVEHLARQLKQDAAAYCTTLLDYYGRGRGWPTVPPGVPAQVAVGMMERAVLDRLRTDLPASTRIDVRLIPYMQVHEFEALLFSDPVSLAAALNRPDLVVPLSAIRSGVATPEDVNDGTATAPSKRIEQLHPGYAKRKPLLGTLAAQAVGLSAMRRACPRFGRWVDHLLTLGQPPAAP